MERSTFDLVDKKHYLFIRIIEAKSLPYTKSPIIKIVISGNTQAISKPASKSKTNSNYQWDQTFAIGRDFSESPSILEISVWDNFKLENGFGGICFDMSQIPVRDPHDTPLASQWYKLEVDDMKKGELRLGTWFSTKEDKFFSKAGKINPRSIVYKSPKLWYLRLTIIGAKVDQMMMSKKESTFQVKAQLGFQTMTTKIVSNQTGMPTWNEDLIFVAAKPFTDDHITVSLESHQSELVSAVILIPLTTVQGRHNDHNVDSKWFRFTDQDEYSGRIHIRVCFEGGYHVMDEAPNLCSDFRPARSQPCKPKPVGFVELKIVGCRDLFPMRMINDKEKTDAYAVAKYGSEWFRTRTVSDSLNPKWNEHYKFDVYDPCTVLTIGVFNNSSLLEINGSDTTTYQDLLIGKIHIRISTLPAGKVYRNMYSLLSLSNKGIRKMGEMELALQFKREIPLLDFLRVYSQPLLPLMHHLKPLDMVQQDKLRHVAANIVAGHLARSEPPLKQEVVLHLLDANSHVFSMRKVRANYDRITNMVAGVTRIVNWSKTPARGGLVLYVFSISTWNYLRKPRLSLPQVDYVADRDELDEEFDTWPSSQTDQVIRDRYEKLRLFGLWVQIKLGDMATQGERAKALVTWQDPRATCIFVVLCFTVALVLYVVPSKMVAIGSAFYFLRHPLFRDGKPSPVLNFFRRLPSSSDLII